jgi:hypothetical protein
LATIARHSNEELNMKVIYTVSGMALLAASVAACGPFQRNTHDRAERQVTPVAQQQQQPIAQQQQPMAQQQQQAMTQHPSERPATVADAGPAMGNGAGTGVGAGTAATSPAPMDTGATAGSGAMADQTTQRRTRAFRQEKG